MRRLGIGTALVLAAAAAACAAINAWPQVMTVNGVRAQPVARGEWIEDYPTALASIAALMTDELGLPAVDATLIFHRDRAAFRAALEQGGYTAEAARVTADTLTAVGGHRRVLINDENLRDAPWPVRIAFIAHELTHTVSTNGQAACAALRISGCEKGSPSGSKSRHSRDSASRHHPVHAQPCCAAFATRAERAPFRR